MKIHDRRWIADGPYAASAHLCTRRGIAAVRFEAVRREVLGLVGHQRVARHLGDHRRGRDRQHRLVALHDRAHDARHARGSRACRRARCGRARNPARRAAPARAARRAAAPRSCRAGRTPSWTRVPDADPPRPPAHAPRRRPRARRASAASSRARPQGARRRARPRQPSPDRPTNRGRPRRCRRRPDRPRPSTSARCAASGYGPVMLAEASRISVRERGSRRVAPCQALDIVVR